MTEKTENKTTSYCSSDRVQKYTETSLFSETQRDREITEQTKQKETGSEIELQTTTFQHLRHESST